MKILLVAVNAKYIHSNLAVYSLKAYAEKYRDRIGIAEYTINHQTEEILSGIYKEQADVIAFSCYIWNISLITRIAAEIRQVQPGVKIWFGGPEVSYDPREILLQCKALDGIVIGEGEQTFLELAEYYMGERASLHDIEGLAFKDSARINKNNIKSYITTNPNGTVDSDKIINKSENASEKNKNVAEEVTEQSIVSNDEESNIIFTSARAPMNMNTIPFPYEDIEAFRNKIIYYESSRGCPYSCSYCLSSIDHGVRFRSMELVKQELKAFLDQETAQVKFVDRTFNCNRRHTMELWQFIKEHDNGITNFHFEVTADILNEEELTLLSTLRPGQVQLEIGVQSTNPTTVQAIRRNVDFTKLSENVRKIQDGKNVHQHLDLIAGLPLEDFNAFSKSFDDVYRLKPDQLQLGFLKVLKGSLMELESKDYGIVYRETPPYEVLYTKDLSYGEVLKLKGICDMVEVYYNSGQFTYSLQYLEHYYESPFRLYLELANYYEDKGYNLIAHSRIRRYEILLDFYKAMILKQDELEEQGQERLFSEILIFDLCLREGIKNRPGFASEPPEYKKLQELKASCGTVKGPSHIEHFIYDIITSAKTGKILYKDQYILFNYGERDPIDKSAIWNILQ